MRYPESSALDSVKRSLVLTMIAALLGFTVIPVGAQDIAAQTQPGEPDAPPDKAQTQAQPEVTEAPAAEPAKEDADNPMAGRIAAAAKAYEELAEAYLSNDWDALKERSRLIRRHQRFLNREQRRDVAYINKTKGEFRPKWWGKCSSSSNISFKAEIWNRPLMANYMPTNKTLGVQRVEPEGRYRKNRRGQYEWEITKLNVIVSWKPNLVDSNSPGGGKLSEIHGTKLGELGELIVWHELGHCYITNYLPLDHVVELYQEHEMLFSHLQEFYADLTALHHTSPRARRAVLMFRLQSLDYYDESEEHARASHAVGSIVLFEVLSNPEAWPSFHFPPAVPEQQVELNTIIYLYEHMDPKWSIKEARALRSLAQVFIKKSGEKTLRARGVLPLPHKLSMSLMAGRDHKLQVKRDQWVAQRLQALIASGRADQLEEDETYDPPIRRPLSDSDDHHRDAEALRMDIPR